MECNEIYRKHVDKKTYNIYDIPTTYVLHIGMYIRGLSV